MKGYLVLFLGLVLATSDAARGADPQPHDPVVPDGVDPTVALLRKGQTEIYRSAIVLSDQLTAFRTPDGKGSALPVPMGFGDLLYVIHEEKVKGPHRYLVGRFRNGGKTFLSAVGWVNPMWLSEGSRALAPKQARIDIETQTSGDNEWRKSILGRLPSGERLKREANHYPIRALTGLDRGMAAFTRPVPSAGWAEAFARKTIVRPLQSYQWYFVHKLTVVGREAWVLLSNQETLDLESADLSNVGNSYLGWLHLNDASLVISNETVLPNNEPLAWKERRETRQPIRYFSSLAQARAYSRGESVDEDKRPVRPVAEESFGVDPQAFPPTALGWPILDRTLDAESKRSILQVAMLSCLHRNGKLVTAQDIERHKEKIGAVIERMKVLEIVCVLDSSGSMSESYPAVRAALRDLLDEVSRAAKGKDILSDLRIRLGLVLYRDKGDEYVVRTIGEREGEKYFHEASNPDELAKFFETLGAAVSAGGGDALEDIFAGVHSAVNKHFKVGRADQHMEGSKGVILVVGDSGAHSKKGTKPAFPAEGDIANADHSKEDVLSWLGVVKSEQRISNISIGSVYVENGPGIKSAAWDSQIPFLAEKTGGRSFRLPFSKERQAAAPEALKAYFRGLLEARRKLLREAGEDFLKSFARNAPDGTPVVPLSPAFDLAEASAVTMFGKTTVDEMRADLRQTAFLIASVPLTESGDTRDRFKTRILVTRQMLNDLQSLSSTLATAFRKELENPEASKGGAETFKKLLIRAWLTSVGRDPSEWPNHMKKPFSELTAMFEALPIALPCLAGDPPNGSIEAHALAKRLKDGAARLDRLIRFDATWVRPGTSSDEEFTLIEPGDLP